MDLRLMSDEASAAEHDAIDRIAGSVELVELEGRLVRSGHGARSHRHLLLPALSEVQSQIGYVSRGALNEICRRLVIPPAEAFGVASFYALISTEPRPPVVRHICDDIACRLVSRVEALDQDDVVASPCLGQCDRRPAVLVQRAGEDDLVEVGSESVVHAGPLLRRVGVVDPGSLNDYRASGGFQAHERARAMGAEAIIAEVKASLLKGRGGAAFPTGVKWEAVAKEPAPRYLVCNADESEPGTFKDRVVMEGDPFALVEAIAIAAFATGSQKAYIYVRGEYPLATARMRYAISESEEQLAGLEIEVFRGQGAYICGEETALFNSIEGFRGEPRQKPPFPVQSGLFGRPTVINNVETLINVNRIVLEGGEAFARSGSGESTGTRLFCLSGDVSRPGTYEVEMGTTLGDLIDLAGGPINATRTILLGGAAGSFVDLTYLDLPLTFEAARERKVSLGSGVVMLFNEDRDMNDVVRRVARFFRDESCGQCVPCRVGTVRVEEAVARAQSAPIDRQLIADIDLAMKDASICGLGHTAAAVVQSAIGLGLI